MNHDTQGQNAEIYRVALVFAILLGSDVDTDDGESERPSVLAIYECSTMAVQLPDMEEAVGSNPTIRTNAI